MDFLIKKQKHSILIILHGNLDRQFTAKSRDACDQLVEKIDRNLIIDLTAVKKIDSSGIGFLSFLYKRLHASQLTLTLIGLKKKPWSLFKQLHLDEILKSEYSR